VTALHSPDERSNFKKKGESFEGAGSRVVELVNPSMGGGKRSIDYLDSDPSWKRTLVKKRSWKKRTSTKSLSKRSRFEWSP